MNMLTIKTGTSVYRVYIGKGLLYVLPDRLKQLFPESRFVIITDTTVFNLYGNKLKQYFSDEGLDCHVLTVEPGEGSKRIETLSRLLSALAQRGYNRADVIIALGGGVVGDLAGFTAAVYLRGIRYVQAPTTLLAQIDSSIGGKTAVNLPEGKNLAGAFYQPSAVFADTDVLKTLPEEEFANGMAEIIKHSLIKDASMFVSLEEGEAINAHSDSLEGLIVANLAIKRDVVAVDERDKGERMLLNFGHTIGHGIERCCAALDTPVTHGKAVAMGMAAIAAAGERAELTAEGTTARIIKVLEKAGLPHDISKFDKDEIIKGIFIDKKNVADTLNLVMIKSPGNSFLYNIPRHDVRRFI
ncbi:MAG: 3-dehydroquinate synthase [Christensenellales bacterium]